MLIPTPLASPARHPAWPLLAGFWPANFAAAFFPGGGGRGQCEGRGEGGGEESGAAQTTKGRGDGGKGRPERIKDINNITLF